MSDERIILTPAEATSLLHEDVEYVHNYTAGPMMIGIDYKRDDAIAAFEKAAEIELAGPMAQAMKHPIAVFEGSGRVTFFEADMEKVSTFEADRESS